MKPTDLRFRRDVRVRNRADYLNIQRSGRKWRGRSIVLLTIPNNLSLSRFGITVSRRNGNAVKRNRFKRRIREIQRIHRSRVLSGHDVVVIARPGAVNAPYRQLEAEYLRLVRLAGLMAGDE